METGNPLPVCSILNFCFSMQNFKKEGEILWDYQDKTQCIVMILLYGKKY